ncbi:HAD family hydrolase [Streptomyces sp. NPDC001089]
MRYDLVIFDHDGVLVGSEPIAGTVLAEYLSELGHATSYDDVLRDYLGASSRRVHDVVLERTGEPLPAEFDETLRARTSAALERKLSPVRGMEEVLGALTAHGISYCLASSASHDQIRVALRAAGIDDFFEEEWMCSAEDVAKEKPAPDLYLHAAQQMDVAPSRCVAVEASPIGVRAAVAAGMDAFAFTGMVTADGLPGATGYFGDMDQLPGLLGLDA